jgi:tRNA dimethylallyltransferase
MEPIDTLPVIPDGTKLVAIVGETGSGKSALAMELAAEYNGEIIAADSRTIYKGMDIGTAKPSAEDQAAIPHHLLDVAIPNETFTVSDFKRLANEAITDINNRGKVAFLVGGSGLYIDAVLYDYKFGDPSKKGRDQTNPRHAASGEALDRQKKLPAQTIVIGVRRPLEQLRDRLEARVDLMMADGLLAEAQKLAKAYGWDNENLRTPAYKAMRQLTEGLIDPEQAKQQFVQADLQLAKRQRTWFKRNANTQWLDLQNQ